MLGPARSLMDWRTRPETIQAHDSTQKTILRCAAADCAEHNATPRGAGETEKRNQKNPRATKVDRGNAVSGTQCECFSAYACEINKNKLRAHNIPEETIFVPLDGYAPTHGVHRRAHCVMSASVGFINIRCNDGYFLPFVYFFFSSFVCRSFVISPPCRVTSAAFSVLLNPRPPPSSYRCYPRELCFDCQTFAPLSRALNDDGYSSLKTRLRRRTQPPTAASVCVVGGGEVDEVIFLPSAAPPPTRTTAHTIPRGTSAPPLTNAAPRFSNSSCTVFFFFFKAFFAVALVILYFYFSVSVRKTHLSKKKKKKIKRNRCGAKNVLIRIKNFESVIIILYTKTNVLYGYTQNQTTLYDEFLRVCSIVKFFEK